MKRTNAILRGVGLLAILLGLAANPVTAGKILSPDGQLSSALLVVLIIGCEVVAVGFGVLLLARPQAVRCYVGERKPQLLLAAVMSLLALIAGDIALNLLTPPPYWKWRTKYGWSYPPHERSEMTIHDTPGKFRKITRTRFENGFNRWGDPTSRRPRIFIVGDSYTDMAYVSNGEEWYAVLEREFPELDFFVYGTGGWSSLQEYMILDDFIDGIRPDVTLWQFCGGNDYENNDYARDLKSYPRNNFGVRPYLEDGQVVYRMPMMFPELRKYSRLAAYSLSILDKRAQKYSQTHPGFAPRPAVTDADKARSFNVTLAIMKKARERAKGIPFFVFNTSHETETDSALFNAAGLIHIQGVEDRVDAKGAEGPVVRVVDDGHWNLAGNQIAGNYLAKCLREQPKFMQVVTRTGTGSGF